MRKRWIILVYIVILLSALIQKSESQVHGNMTLPLKELVLHYYKVNKTCTYAEQFILHQVTLAWKKDRSITPALLRLLYSDCYVTGCDASILLNGEGTEKEAPQNVGLRAFDIISRIKCVLEIRCPGVVSYADILNLATRDVVGLAGAPKYPVFIGRGDGLKSNVKLVDLSSPSISWNQALAYFKTKGLEVLDLGTYFFMY